MQDKKSVTVNKCIFKILRKGFVGVSLCSAIGCITAVAQTGFQGNQPGGQGGDNKLLLEIAKNTNDIAVKTSNIATIQKNSGNGKVSAENNDLLSETVYVTPDLNSKSPTSAYSLNLKQPTSVSLKELSPRSLAEINNNNNNSTYNSSSSLENKESFNKLFVTTYCGYLAKSNESNRSFKGWVLSGLQQNTNDTQRYNSPAVLNDDQCLSYFMKLRKSVQSQYSNTASNPSNFGAISTSANTNWTSALFNGIRILSNSYTSNTETASLTDILSDKNTKGYNLKSFCNKWIKLGIADRVKQDKTIRSSEVPALRAAYLACNTAGDINKEQRSEASTKRSSLINGLLNSQLNDGYFEKLNNSSSPKLLSIIALNGIVSNYLLSQHNSELKEIKRQNNVLLLAQMAALVEAKGK